MGHIELPLWLRQLRVCLQHGKPGFDPWVGKIPWRRKWQPTPVLLPGKSHGWRNLAGYSPWGHRVGHDWATSLSFFLCGPHRSLLHILWCFNNSLKMWKVFFAHKLNNHRLWAGSDLRAQVYLYELLRLSWAGAEVCSYCGCLRQPPW